MEISRLTNVSSYSSSSFDDWNGRQVSNASPPYQSFRFKVKAKSLIMPIELIPIYSPNATCQGAWHLILSQYIPLQGNYQLLRTHNRRKVWLFHLFWMVMEAKWSKFDGRARNLFSLMKWFISGKQTICAVLEPHCVHPCALLSSCVWHGFISLVYEALH